MNVGADAGQLGKDPVKEVDVIFAKWYGHCGSRLSKGPRFSDWESEAVVEGVEVVKKRWREEQRC